MKYWIKAIQILILQLLKRKLNNCLTIDKSLAIITKQNCIGEWLNGRATVSKTVGCVFESRLPCQKSTPDGVLF